MSASHPSDVVAAVIVDIVGSRTLGDRGAAQSAVRTAFAAADEQAPPHTPLWSTVGDEFQAIYPDAASAAIATTVARLALADGYDVRFGIGLGRSTVIDDPERAIYDGSAWWNARTAIEEAERRGQKSATARTWARDDAGDAHALTPALLLRDHVITSMRPRERRIAAGLIAGRFQAEIAEQEGVTQSAVSQSARRSGANALVQVVAQWREARA